MQELCFSDIVLQGIMSIFLGISIVSSILWYKYLSHF